jgi:hypothetical protein
VFLLDPLLSSLFLYVEKEKNMKHRLQEFLLDMVRQLFGMSKPRQGKLILTRNALNRMYEHQLDVETLEDMFRLGEEEKQNKITRKYADYSVGLYYKHDIAENKYVITTCWKGGE